MSENVLHASPVRARAWLAVIALGVSAFSIVTSELAPVGMLSLLAKGLNQSESGAGLAVTAYGWVGALAALISGAVPARIPRKALLAGLMLILALSCMAASCSHSMTLFMSARMAGALAHGAFWALIGSVAAQLVPPEKIGLATSVIFGGVSAASVLGVPLSSFIADAAGWRNAFMAISLLSLATACVLFMTLPAIKSPQASGLRVYAGILRNPVLLSLYGITACIICAHFAAFTYLAPLLTTGQQVAPSSLPLLLLVSGAAGLGGNIIAGKLIDRHIKTLILVSLFLCAGVLGLLGMKSVAPLPFWLTGVLLAVWGAAIAVVFVGLQTWLLRSAGDAIQPASGIYVAIFNAAIGTGALAGGQLLTITGAGGMALLAALVMLCSTLLVLRLKSPE